MFLASMSITVVLPPGIPAGFGRSTCTKNLVILGPTDYVLHHRVRTCFDHSRPLIPRSSRLVAAGIQPRSSKGVDRGFCPWCPWNCIRRGQYVRFPIHHLIVICSVPRSLPAVFACRFPLRWKELTLDTMLVVFSDCSFLRLSISLYHSHLFFSARCLLFASRSLLPCIIVTRARISVLPMFCRRMTTLVPLSSLFWAMSHVLFSGQCRYGIACDFRWRK